MKSCAVTACLVETSFPKVPPDAASALPSDVRRRLCPADSRQIILGAMPLWFRLSLKVKKACLAKGFRSFENLFRPGAHPVILSEIEPAHGAGGIHQEFSWPRNVLAIDSGAGVNQVVTANRFSFRIRKKSECISGFLAEVAVNFGTVHADGNRVNSRLVKLIQTLFNAPQLGVA